MKLKSLCDQVNKEDAVRLVKLGGRSIETVVKY